MISEKAKKLNYINIFRALAIIIVVISHAIDVKNPYIHRIYMELFSFGSTLFLFISGFLFQYLSKNFNYTVYLKKKWLNIILPYIIMSIPGIIYCLFHQNIFSVYSPIFQIFLYIVTAIIHNPPTWYILLITVYFLLSKLLIIYSNNNILYKIMPILALFTIFVRAPQWNDTANINSDLFYNYFALIYIIIMIIISIHFLFIYVLGMYFASNQSKIEDLYKKRLFVWIGMIFIFVTDIYLMKYNISQNGDISKIFLSVLLLIYLQKYDFEIQKHKNINKIFTKISEYSFGIFLVHWYVLMIFNKLFINDFSQVYDIYSFVGNILFMLFKFLFIFSVSFGICYFSKQILNKLGINKTRSFMGV